MTASLKTESSAWLSVLLPTYNGAQYIHETLESVLNNGPHQIHIIAIDAGSSDNTVQIIESFSDRLSIELHIKPKSKNWVWSTNYALTRAQTKFCCILHQDDTWQPSRTETLKNYTTAYPNHNTFIHETFYIDKTSNIVGRLRLPKLLRKHTHNQASANKALLIQNFISIPSCIFKTKIAKQLRGWDEELWYTADWDFWLKCLKESPPIWIPQPLCNFRVHSQSQTAQGARHAPKILAQLNRVTLRHKDIYPKAYKLSCVSNNLNYALAELTQRNFRPILSSLYEILRLPIGDVITLIDCSRILPRITSRLKIKFRQ